MDKLITFSGSSIVKGVGGKYVVVFLCVCMYLADSQSVSLLEGTESLVYQELSGEKEQSSEDIAKRTHKVEVYTEFGELACNEEFVLKSLLELIKKNSGLKYDRNNLADCSGVFHRVAQGLKKVCPEIEAQVPPISERSSRSIAKWYYQHGNYTKIEDPLASEHLIKAGSVMFFGKQSQAYFNENPIEKCWVEGGIRHVGIVVAVNRDPISGKIHSYELFHGRYPGGPLSGVSGKAEYMHLREPTRAVYPVFGNGKDPWIGVSELIIN